MKLAALSTLALTLCHERCPAQEPTTIRFWTNAVAQSPSFDKERSNCSSGGEPDIEVRERTTTGGTQYNSAFD